MTLPISDYDFPFPEELIASEAAEPRDSARLMVLDRATGGGMWLMNGAHMVDRTCWVLDTAVASVRAWIGSPFHGLPADDANMVFLQLRNGLHATVVHAGGQARGVEKCEVEVSCTDGMLRFDSYSNRLFTDRDGAYVPIDCTAVDPFTEELKNLVGAVRGTEALRVPPGRVRPGIPLIPVLKAFWAWQDRRRSGLLSG